jgi:hypothetical protein
MTTMYDVTQRWVDRVFDLDLRERNSRRSNVFADGDYIYSYGRHFEMARVVRDKRGNPKFVLLNGDTYSVSTSRHQNDLRSALSRLPSDLPVLIVPHRALKAARISIDSIVPLDVRPDGIEYRRQSSETLPKAAKRLTLIKPGTPLKDGCIHHYNMRWRDQTIGYIEACEKAGTEFTVIPAESGGWQEVRRDADGTYHWHTTRHWLGDSVFMARRIGETRRTRWLSSFDRQETTPLYFLCQLPPCKAETYAEAIEALKPDPVVLAESMGRTVERQGDIFAIPMPGLDTRTLTKRGGVRARRWDAMAPDRARRKAARLANSMRVSNDLQRNVWGRSSGGGVPWREQQERVRPVVSHRHNKWSPIFQQWVEDAEENVGRPEDIALLGTAHTATEVITMPDGTQYARGMMYHDPELMGEARERDHIRRRLGDGKVWHMVCKNTVPTA